MWSWGFGGKGEVEGDLKWKEVLEENLDDKGIFGENLGIFILGAHNFFFL